MKMDIGISAQDRGKMAGLLGRVLADSYVLQLKTQNYHWNVTGPLFLSLHGLFQEQYSNIALAVDAIAERIRSIGEFTPGSMSEFLRLTQIKEQQGSIRADAMLADLVAAHETILKSLGRALELADDIDDDVSEDLMIQRLEWHQKAAWMLRSMLPEASATSSIVTLPGVTALLPASRKKTSKIVKKITAKAAKTQPKAQPKAQAKSKAKAKPTAIAKTTLGKAKTTKVKTTKAKGKKAA